MARTNLKKDERHTMNIDQRISDQLMASKDARLFIERSIAEAHGWNPVLEDRNADIGAAIYLYVFDIQAGVSWMAVGSFDDFATQASRFREAPFAWSEATSMLNSTVIELLGHQSAPPDADKAEVLTKLFGLLPLQAGTTKVCFEPGLLTPGAHYMVLRYAGANGGGFIRSFLYPASMAEGSGVLDAEEIAQILCGVIQDDYKNHPEAFHEIDYF
jgi:hypothetical protein